ncbi:MAG TPA: YHS domain-containing (seleno)protein [Alphaproteobacteria bacterium]|nr:YHS domain-containing (seleno)protein [Alphaproteobacteria bacterium]
MALIFRTAIAALAGVFMIAAAQAQSFNNDRGLGAKGYDVVAYFTDGKAVMGSPQFTHEHGGVNWQFASAEHRDMFKADPSKYVPQYGGYCAYGIAVGGLYDVQPDKAWSVVDGKLYLNKDPSVKQTWLKDVPGNISKAEANWPKIRK